MAIEMNLDRKDTEIRAPIPAAYAKVVNVRVMLEGRNQVWIDVAVYADEEARQDPDALSVDKHTIKTSLADFQAVAEPTGLGEMQLKAAAYRYLKTLEQFKTGKDV
jgi:hypothetical protein